MSGKVDAVDQMEPWIALAEKNGCKSVGDAHYIDPAPYSEIEFRKTYERMLSWGLIDADMTYEDLVNNRISAV